MTPTLRRVEPSGPPGRLARAYAWLAGTRPATFVSRHLNWKLDPILLRLTRGRVSTTLFFPTAVLVTTGARTGAERRNAAIYFHDGDRAVVVASNAGAPRHPAWFHNLTAHPEVTLGGAPMTAAVVTDPAEQARLWPLAVSVFPAFAGYRRTAEAHGRTIPLVVLSPSGVAAEGGR